MRKYRVRTTLVRTRRVRFLGTYTPNRVLRYHPFPGSYDIEEGYHKIPLEIFVDIFIITLNLNKQTIVISFQ
jgi:hypothetical protein